MKKVFTPVGVTFKGGGFYKTDSRGKSSTSSRSSSSSGSDSSSSRAEEGLGAVAARSPLRAARVVDIDLGLIGAAPAGAR